MKFVLFGAGRMGLIALNVLGADNVECFSDNNKAGTVLCEKRIISFDEMITLKDICIVIASDIYASEMEQQLIDAGISDYVLFHKRYNDKMNGYLPKYSYLHNTQYMFYTDILLNYRIYKYKSIVVYGVNPLLINLLFEIAIQVGIDKVKAIVSQGDEKEIYGIPVISEDEIGCDYDCLIINKPRKESGIREKTFENGMDIIDIYDVDKFIYFNNHPELSKFKDIHKNKRVFIVGNGPSVRLDDLEKLAKHKEICFGMNKIHRIFDEVTWRPNYICMTDSRVIFKCEKDIDLITKDSEVIMGDLYHFTNVKDENKINYVHLKSEYYAPNYPGFTDDVTSGVFWGYSVTYDIALQFAAYMGASEIYLIGIDNNNVGVITDKRNHFIKNYYDKEDENSYNNVVANFEAMNVAYEKAEKYSRNHGFRIFNATRGGKLEAFERVDFDSLFEEVSR